MDFFLQDRIYLHPAQLEQCKSTRAWAQHALTEIDMCCAVFKIQIETKMAAPRVNVNDIQLLEAGNLLHDSFTI